VLGFVLQDILKIDIFRAHNEEILILLIKVNSTISMLELEFSNIHVHATRGPTCSSLAPPGPATDSASASGRSDGARLASAKCFAVLLSILL